MSMIAYKCPHIEVVVLDINEGALNPRMRRAGRGRPHALLCAANRFTCSCCLGAAGAPAAAAACRQPPDRALRGTCAERIKAWNSDKLPIYEPGLDDIVLAVRGKNLFFSTDTTKHLNEADMIFVRWGPRRGSGAQACGGAEAAQSACAVACNSSSWPMGGQVGVEQHAWSSEGAGARAMQPL